MLSADWPLPIIDRLRCSGCGNCVQRCPTHAVELRAGLAYVVRPQDCTFCEICETYCPEGAIGRPFRIVFAPDQQAGASVNPLEQQEGTDQ